MARKPVILRFLGDTRSLSRAFLKASGEAQTFGARLGKVSMGVALGVGAMVGGAAVALAKLGGDFHKAYANIRVTTGQTGKTLAGLETSFKNVLSQTPAGMGDVSAAIAGINQKLGLTGKPLESFALQMIRLGRITGADVKSNLESVTSVLNNWSVPASKAADTTDMLFRASQKSGVAVGQLASELASSGAQFRSVGFSMQDTTAIIAMLGKQGLSTKDVVPALAKAMAKAAKDGKPAAQAFRETFDAIKGAPNDVKASQKALEVFGSRAGPKLATLIREGKLSYDEFSKSIASGDTIAKAASDTATWQGKLGLLKNQVKVALEPLATKVFGALTDAMSKVMPYLRRFGDWFSKNKETLKPYAIALGAVAAALSVVAIATAAWNAVLAINPITLIIVAIAALVVGIIYAYQHFESFRNVMDAIGRWIRDKFVPALRAIGDWIVEHIWPAIKAFGAWFVDDLVPALWHAMQFVGEAFAKGAWAVKTVFVGLWDGIVAVWHATGEPFFDVVVGAFDLIVAAGRTTVDTLGAIFDGIASVVKIAWNGIATLWNNTVGKISVHLPDILGGWGFDVPDLPYLAEGGIVTRATVAMIGEAGPEAVIPLRKLNTGGNTYSISVHALDPKSAATAVVDALKHYERTRGPVPVRTRIA